MSKRLEDYAMIGDGHTIALVSRNGSIDWLCLPRFDSDACFAALLGDERHGNWTMTPETADFETSRRYCGDTLVLETEFKTPAGTAQVLDFMPIRKGEHSAVIRIVNGMDGEVAMRSELRLRFDYGVIAPWYSDHDDAIVGKVGPDLVAIHSDVPLRNDAEALTARFSIKSGQQIIFTLQHNASMAPVPERLDAKRLLPETKSWWRNWIANFKHPTEWPEFTKRSLIVLKALIYQPAGGIVAAGTTSLPEKPGGRMNWDYRYCWLRDSTFTLTAFLNAGFQAEAQAWLYWLLRAIAGTPERIRIAYRVDGGRRLEEWEPDWLPGFDHGRPVRVGNAAAGQRQLDVIGEIIDSTHIAERAGLERSEWEAEIERRLVLRIAATWRNPDHGFWEIRGRPRHYVYSKVMAWVAVDRFLKMKRTQSHCDEELRIRLERLRDEMHAEICAKGYSETRGSFVSHYGTTQLDANLLLLPLVGFLPIEDPRMSRTVAAIETELMEDGLVRRRKGSPSGREEGCFIACTCWLADCKAMQGRENEARALLMRVMDIANDVGLLSEEYHTGQRRLVGNFPQTLSHLAFVNAALGLSGTVLQRAGG
ncbi:MAG TPA: glycoside hydrolase family 15 protein [Acidocella sp.]|nr:glycoside hydrolase family 15 protein [Acidocella sp.]